MIYYQLPWWDSRRKQICPSQQRQARGAGPWPHPGVTEPADPARWQTKLSFLPYPPMQQGNQPVVLQRLVCIGERGLRAAEESRCQKKPRNIPSIFEAKQHWHCSRPIPAASKWLAELSSNRPRAGVSAARLEARKISSNLDENFFLIALIWNK